MIKVIDTRSNETNLCFASKLKLFLSPKNFRPVVYLKQLEELLPKDNEKIRLPFAGPIESSEPQGFTPDQMIRCEECLRANPPTRVSCLYCGSTLPQTEDSVRFRKPTLRRPDKGQQGYNNIFLPEIQNNVADGAMKEAADLLKLAPEVLEKIVYAQRPLPVAWTASRADASLVDEKLRELGLKTLILADDVLGGESSVVRIRSIRFDEHEVIMQQAGATEATAINWEDLVLAVLGRLIEKRIAVKERKSGRSENEIVDTSEFFADEVVVDLYTAHHSKTWRISAGSFDFSCLGQKMALIASENLVTLINVIRERAPRMELDESYNALRQTLETVWPFEQEMESGGWRRERPGMYSIEAVAVNTNESQFTRFSRLCHYLESESSKRAK